MIWSAATKKGREPSRDVGPGLIRCTMLNQGKPVIVARNRALSCATRLTERRSSTCPRKRLRVCPLSAQVRQRLAAAVMQKIHILTDY
jgi:hypothetical protein